MFVVQATLLFVITGFLMQFASVLSWRYIAHSPLTTKQLLKINWVYPIGFGIWGFVVAVFIKLFL